ncbi:MAG: DUF721 domain-containing protein [Alphaproteobacteria bacterium]|uniref:DUF721 domain-containing protein n=1 Tax=Candidatus Nitrobium versatile TaxID=2884831 RepID=A0A953M1F5_9BACT|nr:DUF721 domain-containing protein [Candidatus Nitrobium versatile]
MRNTGSILTPLLRELGLEEKVRLNSLQQEWRNLFGEPLSLHTYPAEIKEGELLINVDSPGWMQQLKFYKQEIAGKLHAYHIKNVRFRHGMVYRRKGRSMMPAKNTLPERPPLSAPDREWIEQTLSAVKDPELREGFRKALEKAVARKGREVQRKTRRSR